MNSFKEWLSDYLRYFVLILALLLALGAIFLGVKLYQSTQTVEGDPDSITIVEGSEGETETASEVMTEAETESKTEKVTEENTEKVTEKVSEQEETEVETLPEETNAPSDNGEETQTTEAVQTAAEARTPQVEPIAMVNDLETQKQTENERQTEAPLIEIIETEAPQTEPPQTEPPETDPPETEPPEPVYLTMTGTCYMRSYADYGDNIMGTYQAGTVVEFLEDVGGWYKVQVDGNVGYMGSRFFH